MGNRKEFIWKRGFEDLAHRGHNWDGGSAPLVNREEHISADY